MGINRTPDKKSRSQIKGFRAKVARLMNLKLKDERKNPTIILRRGVFNCAYSFSILIQGLKDECIISIFSIKLTVTEAPEKSRKTQLVEWHKAQGWRLKATAPDVPAKSFIRLIGFIKIIPMKFTSRNRSKMYLTAEIAEHAKTIYCFFSAFSHRGVGLWVGGCELRSEVLCIFFA